MRIAYVAYIDLSKSGAGPIHIGAIAGGLAKLGHDVTLFVPEWAKPFELNNVEIRWVPHRIPTVMGWSFAAAQKLRKEAGAYDIIYMRDFYSGVQVLKEAARSGIPSLLEVNGSVRAEMLSVPRMSKGRLIAKLDWAYFLERKLELADKVIVVSPNLIEELAPKCGNAEKFVFLPNGVDLNLFTPANDKAALRRELNLPENAMIVGVVGSMLNYHIESPIIRAVEILIERFPDLICLFVGGGPAESRIREKVAASEAAENIRIIGRVPVERSAKYISALDVALAWSTKETAENGWPMRVSAYAACGVPGVAPDWGCYLYCEKKGSLLTATGGNAEAISETVARLLDNPELAGHISRKARNWAENELSWDKITKKTERIMAELIGDLR